MCIDVDTYKDPALEEWESANLPPTLTHQTRSGGRHYIYKHPGGDVWFPATLRPGVDMKAAGNGYICWPGTEGYVKMRGVAKIAAFPMKLVQQALIEKGGTGKTQTRDGGYVADSDEELIEQIQTASSLYPALRSLSYRMAARRDENGKVPTEAEMITVLENLMHTSVAADNRHARHDDWLDRLRKIPELVSTAIDKEKNASILSEAEIAAIRSSGPSLMPAGLTATHGPIGPQRETKPSDIEKRVAELKPSSEDGSKENDDEPSSDFVKLDVRQLNAVALPPIKWVVPRMIPEMATVSLAGMSNVGKTRWLAALVMALAVGDTERMGLPQCDRNIATVWIANEERTEDICRRLKAVVRQHGDEDSADIYVRGKGAGMLRLVAMNEAGILGIDEANIAKVVKEIRDANAKLVIFDPYVTLSDAADENSAASASMTTKAFLLITSLTGAACLHAHHTPKDRSKDNDWVRGDASAWRGSGAIYSALDCGFTLSNWMPKNGEQKKAWKQQYLSAKLSRFIVLDTGKIREGEALDPIVMELVGQEMAEGEGDPIGVCKIIPEAAAADALLDVAIASIAASALADEMVDRLGGGEHKVLAKIHKSMEGVAGWPSGKRLQGRDLEKLCSGIFTKRWVMGEGGYRVKFVSVAGKGTEAKWVIVIKKEEPEDE